MEKIVRFKDALGLTAEDAAAAHIDVGRRFQRLGNEAGGRVAQSEYKKVMHGGSWEVTSQRSQKTFQNC